MNFLPEVSLFANRNDYGNPTKTNTATATATQKQ